MMYRRIVKSVVFTAVAAFVAVPTSGDVIRQRETYEDRQGSFHIRLMNEAPPQARRERRMARAHRDDVWIRGYWDVQDDQWSWVSGRWDRPRDRGVRWVNARYEREGRAWRYEPAHWSNQRLVESDDYRRWRDDRRSDRDRRRDDRDRNRDRRN